MFDRVRALDGDRRMALASRGKNTPLLGMELAGRVLVTIAAGRIAYEAPDA